MTRLLAIGGDAPVSIQTMWKSSLLGADPAAIARTLSELELLGCDAIAMLPGWQKSEGAHLEMHVAHRVGIDILDATDIQAPADAVALAA